MPAQYTGNPLATQSPASPPDVDVLPILNLPLDSDVPNVDSIYQSFKVLADYVAWLMLRQRATTVFGYGNTTTTVVTLSGTASISVPTQYENLIIAPGATVTVTAPFWVYDTLTIGAGATLRNVGAAGSGITGGVGTDHGDYSTSGVHFRGGTSGGDSATDGVAFNDSRLCFYGGIGGDGETSAWGPAGNGGVPNWKADTVWPINIADAILTPVPAHHVGILQLWDPATRVITGAVYGTHPLAGGTGGGGGGTGEAGGGSGGGAGGGVIWLAARNIVVGSGGTIDVRGGAGAAGVSGGGDAGGGGGGVVGVIYQDADLGAAAWADVVLIAGGVAGGAGASAGEFGHRLLGRVRG